jgi:outer membrane receptor protein involved in Fe transport
MAVRLLLAILLCSLSASAASLTGTVRDASGGPIEGATVQLVTPSAGPVVGQTRTASDGTFTWQTAPAAPVRLRVTASGFAAHDVLLTAIPDRPLAVVLAPESVYSSVTVAAAPTLRGLAEDGLESPHLAIVRSGEQLREQPLPTLGHAIANEPGILLQQSSAAQVSPFLRGLTGYQVLNLVDGIRFNNSTFRSGPNQYLAYIEPSQADRVEAVLGPTGVAWGSDALGGAIHVVTAQPSFGPGEVHGEAHLAGSSTDLSGAGGARVSMSTARFFALGGASGRRHNDLRAGGGVDSRNVFRRFFGMPDDAIRQLIGDRQQDSGFRQYGVEGRFAARVRPDQILTVNYQRGVQDQARGYKDLLGGLGRLISTFEPQELDWLYGRYEKLGLGWLDSLSGTVSFNGQTDGGRRQNLLLTDPITTDRARVNVYGYIAQATAHVGPRLLTSFGGELYDEHLTSTREVFNPAIGGVTRPRPLYPDDSRYQNTGAFAQASYQIARSLRASAGVRFTGVRFATQENREFGIPDSSQWFRDVTFQTSLQWQVAGPFGMHAVVSRGFRAPNLNDLGALGLNDLGYEIPASEAIGAGALLATDAGEGALSKGTPIRALAPESLMNYEFGMRFRTNRVYARAQFFDAELYDPIVRRTLLFSAGAPPTTLAGLPVRPITPTAAQRQQGVVTVATSFDPRAVKAFVNDGQSRYYGVEAMARVGLTRRLSLEGNYSYIIGRDLFPNRTIRRLPPAMAAARLRYMPSGRRPWVEVSVTGAAEQTRLSGGDRDDERIGASFRRADIASFFHGSRVAPLVNRATGVFGPTGETLAQIQNRVLPIGATVNGVRIVDDSSRAPMYLSTAGWAVVSVRSGLPLGERWSLNAGVENLLDRNYRYHGSGVDAPGVNAWAGMRFVF